MTYIGILSRDVTPIIVCCSFTTGHFTITLFRIGATFPRNASLCLPLRSLSLCLNTHMHIRHYCGSSTFHLCEGSPWPVLAAHTHVYMYCSFVLNFSLIISLFKCFSQCEAISLFHPSPLAFFLFCPVCVYTGLWPSPVPTYFRFKQECLDELSPMMSWRGCFNPKRYIRPLLVL